MFDFRLADFIEQLTPAFEKQGYKWVASGQQYRKMHEHGFSAVVLSPSVYDDEVIVEVSLGSHHRIVEDLVNNIGKQALSNRSHSFTAITTLGKQLGLKNKRLRAGTEEQSVELAEALLEFFDNGGFRLLETLSSQKGLNTALNNGPDLKSIFANNQLLRCFRGLAVAHLEENKNLDKLAQAYFERLEELGAPAEMQKRFIRMYEYFKAFGLN